MISLFVTTMVIQLCNGSVGPILALFIKSMAPDSSNIAFLSGMIAAVPGVSALMSAPRLGKLGDRIGTARILMATLIIAVILFFAMSFVTTPLQLGVLRFLLGFADGAMLPAVRTLLVKYSSDPGNRPHFWLQPVVHVFRQRSGPASWRLGLGDGGFPLGICRDGVGGAS